jgi:hypothetical protein
MVGISRHRAAQHERPVLPHERRSARPQLHESPRPGCHFHPTYRPFHS